AQKYGDDCQESRQCSAYLSRGGTCANGICVCAGGYYYIHGQCHRYSGLSGKCQDDEDCYVHGDFQASKCNEQKICNCAPKYYKREYRGCRPIAEENDGKCIINNDCKGSNATCDFVEHKCVPPGNTASKFLRNDNTLFPEGDAIEQELGERCDPARNETVIDNSVCQNGVWNCILETVASKDNRKCEKGKRSIGSQRKLSLNERYVFSVCVVIARYNDNCQDDVQCYVFGPDAICKDGKCVCNEKSRLNETESFCWTKRGIGENCYQDIDCHLDDYINVRLICDANKLCSCPSGTYPTTDRTACVKNHAGIGDTCGVDKDCEHTRNAKCANKVCVCMDNYYELNKQCVKGINSTCSSHDECKANNSVCESKLCTCKDDHVASSVGSCVRVSTYGESCEEDIQCSSRIPNALCLQSTCACPKGHHYNFGKCFERKEMKRSSAEASDSVSGKIALLDGSLMHIENRSACFLSPPVQADKKYTSVYCFSSRHGLSKSGRMLRGFERRRGGLQERSVRMRLVLHPTKLHCVRTLQR
ncbi:unnamed protein product, partial [Heterotrigona itama]